MFRSKLALLVLLFCLFGALTAFAQRGLQQQCTNQVEIQVHVTYPDERPAPQQLRVDLLDASGVAAMEAFTNDSGQTHFHITGSWQFSAEGLRNRH